MIKAVKEHIACAPWSWLPAPLWFLIAAPLLHWSLGGRGVWFHWPSGVTKNPLRLGFWCVIFID